MRMMILKWENPIKFSFIWIKVFFSICLLVCFVGVFCLFISKGFLAPNSRTDVLLLHVYWRRFWSNVLIASTMKNFSVFGTGIEIHVFFFFFFFCSLYNELANPFNILFSTNITRKKKKGMFLFIEQVSVSGGKENWRAPECIYQTPLAWAGCGTMSIFELSTAGMNSEFSFSLAGRQTKAKEPSLTHGWRGRTGGFIFLPRTLRLFACLFSLFNGLSTYLMPKPFS